MKSGRPAFILYEDETTRRVPKGWSPDAGADMIEGLIVTAPRTVLITPYQHGSESAQCSRVVRERCKTAHCPGGQLSLARSGR
jgi:hypothetical protein